MLEIDLWADKLLVTLITRKHTVFTHYCIDSILGQNTAIINENNYTHYYIDSILGQDTAIFDENNYFS